MKTSTLMAVVLVTLFSAGAAMATGEGGGDGGGGGDPSMLTTPGTTVDLPDQAQVPFSAVPPLQ